jgi:3-oxoacyl-(acyl-carrier-protein) synthase
MRPYLRGITELTVAGFAANANDVDYVNAHASSTGVGEAIETRARPQPRKGSVRSQSAGRRGACAG